MGSDLSASTIQGCAELGWGGLGHHMLPCSKGLTSLQHVAKYDVQS